jgi:predicted metalloendopeptidase
MDHAADPCVDFFQYACGTWNKKHVIPEDRSSISTFEVMADQLQVILKGVLEEPVNLEDNEATRKAKTFYNTCMDIRKSLRTLGLTLFHSNELLFLQVGSLHARPQLVVTSVFISLTQRSSLVSRS